MTEKKPPVKPGAKYKMDRRVGNDGLEFETEYGSEIQP